ncbi:MAG TPA: hypothetical protein VI588_00830, partial [Candidatus Gracilibacteria bacterium]|nr:hypothetical protein [Candidatus Gracilibacteria bacterium]
MKRKNKNPFTPYIALALIAGVAGMYLSLNGRWFENEQALAAITAGSETQMNNTTPSVLNRGRMAIDEKGNTIAVWSMETGTGFDPSGQGVYYRRFDATGTALDAADVLVNSSIVGDQKNPSVAMDQNGNFVITWEGAGDQAGQVDADGVFLKAFQADGTAVGGEIRINGSATNNQERALIAMDYDGPTSATRFVVAWAGFVPSFDNNIYVARFDVDFTQTVTAPVPAGSEVTMYTNAFNQFPTGVAMNNLGEFVVAWLDDPAGTPNYYYQFFAQDGGLLAFAQLNVETVGAYPSVAADKTTRTSLNDPQDRYFIFTYGDTSFNLYVVRIICSDPDTGNGTDTDLACSQDGSKLIVNDTAGTSILRPGVAADYLGNFTVAWEQNLIDGTGFGIAAQSFTYRGKRIGENFVVNTTTAGNEIDPSIAMNTDGFYTISHQGTANRFQNYINEFAKVQNESLAHVSSANNQTTADTDIAPNGNHVQVWKDNADGTIRFTLRQFDNDAAPLQQNVRVDA